ncbi:NADH dehydrogenase [Phycisphaerales bacterium]|nr:NADH dehydrogenase [Phycisphaerales bacterium]
MPSRQESRTLSRVPGQQPQVVIVGGGFGGLNAARALAHAPLQITLVDRRNHHVFQPLLYQVATAALSPAQIAAPIRKILRHQKNVEVVLAEATGVDLARRVLIVDALPYREIRYDYLILAAGATHSYFGRDDWATNAPGLKSIEDALEIRRRFLLAYEAAEREPDPQRRRALLTFVVVGAGPTGVELAGAISEISRTVIRRDFRRIDTSETRVILVEALDRVLPGGFPPEISARALRDLTELGVEVLLGSRVTSIDPKGVNVGDRRIDSHNVFWAAGVRASPLGAMLGAPVDAAGRVIVEPDLSIPGHPDVFVIGDLARVIDPATKCQVPGMCPGAIQMGRFVGGLIVADLARRGTPYPQFHYTDKGLLATIGRARAVAYVGGLKLVGWTAWVFWALLHVFFLIGFRNRLAVMLDWAWDYLFFDRGARLITGGRPAEKPE